MGLAGILAATLLFFSSTACSKELLTRRTGAPVGDDDNSLTCGATGGTLLQDVHLIEKLANFNRERIPERVVHARGAGVHGVFVSYGNFSHLTRNPVFAHEGKTTPAFTRFSKVLDGRQSPEAVRDVRGFATKLYTEAGNWDIVGNNLPVFFIRDAIKFPDLVHTGQPDPVTNLPNANRRFDFFARTPESTKLLTYVFTDLGTPVSFRFMNGFAVHAYKFVNRGGDVKYVKMMWKSMQGVRNLTEEEAGKVLGEDPSHMTHDLYDAISRGEFPSWELQVQVLRPSQLRSFDFDPLDATKDWPDHLPTQTLGKLTLNRIPNNFFQFSEQFAADPGNVVPGVDFSEDRLLQGRIFAYTDTQRYRLTVNHLDLPVNRPLSPVRTNTQNGVMDFVDRSTAASLANFAPSSDPHSLEADPQFEPPKQPIYGTYQSQPIAKTSDFAQAGDLYRSFCERDRANLVSNLAGPLGLVESAEVKVKICAHLFKADVEYGTRVAKAVKVALEEVKKVAGTLHG